MKKNDGMFSSSNRKDSTLVALSLLGVLLCAIILCSDKVFKALFDRSNETSNTPVIGEITFAQNDIRRRSAQSLSWEKTKAEQRIHTGDSVFTGDHSQLQVVMNDGSHISLDQNSLMKFTKIDNVEMSNLTLGNFRVAVDGKMKIAINGEVTEIEGNGSEVQVVVQPKGKPLMRLLKGSVQVKSKSVARKLASDQVVTMEPPAPVQKPVVADKVLPQEALPPVMYTNELYDFFELKNKQLVLREQRRTLLNLPVNISWSTEGNPKQVFAQLSGAREFSNIPESFVAPAQNQSGSFHKAMLGTNFYRLSTNGKEWTEAKEFEVIAGPLAAEDPVLKLKSRRLVILKDSVTLQGVIESDLPAFVVEVSPSRDFPVKDTQVQWMPKHNFSLNFHEAQTLFLRVRGLDSHYKITDASRIVRVDIEKPALPEMPRLATTDVHVFKDDEILLSWQKTSLAQRYHVQILNSKDQVIAQKVVDGDHLSLKANSIGHFKVKLAAEDAYGRSSEQSSQGKITVDPNLLPNPIVKNEDNSRKPAATEMISEKNPGIPDYLNANYSSSNVSIETAAFGMYSSGQVAAQKGNPTAMMVGVRSMSWSGSQGLEASALAKVADLSSDPGNSVNPLDLEALYHYRWSLPFNPFSKFNQSKVSFIGGYEYYKNSGSQFFSPGYQLFKTGFGLAFPLSYRWDTGGEALYGQGLESSHKYEISGYLHYYLDKQWSLGVGYRLHLFEAGSDSASPVGLPYREGFGEGYSVLQWHY